MIAARKGLLEKGFVKEINIEVFKAGVNFEYKEALKDDENERIATKAAN